MKDLNVIAFDFGASSGRAIVGSFSGSKLRLDEIHRFKNGAVELPAGVYWNITGLYREIMEAFTKAAQKNIALSSAAVDTWSVDFGILDKQGELIGIPWSYRDQRISEACPSVHEKISEYRLFQLSGINPDPILSLYQLVSMKSHEKAQFKNGHIMQPIANLLTYFLTGSVSCDPTLASMTALYNVQKKTWEKDLLDTLGLPDLLPDINSNRHIAGMLRENISADTGVCKIPIMSIAGHDSSSAAFAVPAQDRKEVIYISLGTWAVIGCFIDKPIISKEAFDMKFSNEVGYGGEINFVRFHTGFWILQECIKEWLTEGYCLDYRALETEAFNSDTDSSIDPDSVEFSIPGNMNKKVCDYCKRTGQRVPQSKGEIYTAITRGLAYRLSQTLEGIKKLIPREYKRIHVVGGGSKDNYFCDQLHRFTGMEVQAGPVEAASIGNITAQLISLGELKDSGEAARLIRESGFIINTAAG